MQNLQLKVQRYVAFNNVITYFATFALSFPR